MRFQAAEVKEIIYNDSNPNLVYGIKAKLLGSDLSVDSIITATPLNSNILRIPIVGEVVLLIEAPSSYASAIQYSPTLYYLDIVNLQYSVHQNALPTVSQITVTSGATQGNASKYNQTASGNTNKTSEPTVDKNFKQNRVYKSLQPYTGDVLLLGRYGNSIRFSTTPNANTYSVEPKWANGPTSAPITIIRNSLSQTDTKRFNDFITEDFTNDDNIIVMASGQNIEFIQSSATVNAINSKSLNSWSTENWGSTPQTLLSSGRLIFNSTQKEIIAFAKSGIALSSEGHIVLESSKTVTLEGAKVELGNDADQPVILGTEWKQWTESFFDELALLTVSTPNGPSLPLSKSPQWPQIIKLKASLDSLLSSKTFTSK